jgi:carbonic anhydrase/acetyltransferase-like protein (isoleucine patch superfamily)
MSRVERPPRPALARRSFWLAKTGADRARWSTRRLAFLARIHIEAFSKRADVTVDVAPDAKIGAGVRAKLTRGSRNIIRIGPGSSLGERTLLELDGGEVLLGDLVDIRRDGVFTVSGTLVLEGRNMLQAGMAIHCDDRVTIKRMAIIGERTTIVDSAHYFTTPDEWILDNVKTGPVEIGYNVWIGSKVTIGRHVTIGDFAIVAGNALVVTDVPSGHLASGVPAKIVREVKLPWKEGDAEGDEETAR